MAHTHDTHAHDGSAEGAFFGFTSGIMMVIVAIVLAAVIGLIALFAIQPWDDDGGTNTPNVPGVNEPVENPGGGDTGGGDTGGQ
jgi:hypothetical protein